MISKPLMIGIGVLIVSVILLFGGNITGNVVADEGDFQKVTIDMANWQYSPKVIEVEKDKPVRLYLSKNVKGCFRDLTIPEMGITKYLATSKDFIEVTFPEGEYTFACSMFMGSGKIIAK